jgi:L-erythrulose 1-phosphate isomerase
MNARPWLFGTNWKMHKTVREASEYAMQLCGRLKAMNLDGTHVFVIPSYPAIDAVRRIGAGSFWVGAQNMHWAEWGPYTGEISAPMLRELGVDLVELGHAERRQYFNETDPDINRKVQAALRVGIRPLVCVGEVLDDKNYGVERETVARQVRIALHGVTAQQAPSVIIAYEPVWAIGDSGTTADPDYIRNMIAMLRDLLGAMFSADVARAIQLLYGGSVFPQDAPALLASSGANGLFVGRAALDPDEFADLIRDCMAAAPSPSARTYAG